jgi:hypothetical protein
MRIYLFLNVPPYLAWLYTEQDIACPYFMCES